VGGSNERKVSKGFVMFLRWAGPCLLASMHMEVEFWPSVLSFIMLLLELCVSL
jgi:hypothetical protein